MSAKRSRLYCVGVTGLKDWVYAARGKFYGVLATEDARGKCGRRGSTDEGEGTAGSLSAADEWAAMSHRIDAGPPACPARRPEPAATRLRDASLPAGLAAYLMPHFLCECG